MTENNNLAAVLRNCADLSTPCGDCPYKETDGICIKRLLNDAAAETEALQAQLPKRGEWIHSAVVEGTTAGGLTITHTYTCSVCGALLGRKGDKYCYNCGSRNEVEKPEPPKEDA